MYQIIDIVFDGFLFSVCVKGMIGFEIGGIRVVFYFVLVVVDVFSFDEFCEVGFVVLFYLIVLIERYGFQFGDCC